MSLFKPASNAEIDAREDLTPKSLEEAVTQFIASLGEVDKSYLKNASERKDEPMITFGDFFTGMSIRNSWGLWGKNNLTRYFNSIGITHADDMGAMLTTSVHRRLNNKPIDETGQVKFYQDFWKKNGYPDGIPK